MEFTPRAAELTTLLENRIINYYTDLKERKYRNRLPLLPQRREFSSKHNISRLSEERLMRLLETLQITETQFQEMLAVLKIDVEYVVSLLENKQTFTDFHFMMDCMSFIGKNGFYPEDQINLVKNIILNLEKELNSVRDYNVKPEHLNVSADDDFYDQLVEWEKQKERAREIEERRALPDEERTRLEEEETEEIKKEINLWTAILHCLANKPPKVE
jgi:hypothetical protein